MRDGKTQTATENKNKNSITRTRTRTRTSKGQCAKDKRTHTVPLGAALPAGTDPKRTMSLCVSDTCPSTGRTRTEVNTPVCGSADYWRSWRRAGAGQTWPPPPTTTRQGRRSACRHLPLPARGHNAPADLGHRKLGPTNKGTATTMTTESPAARGHRSAHQGAPGRRTGPPQRGRT